ncbi:Predicted PurR-regulated permease PerM [Flexibacter flexilis DSM 6793]|uniref:Predicted PurR-regulated permease PerM n=1 Tax=Flexibacter flexilis DSM 6793 TaxID=927664 RepID=A0A1I1DHF6_9BACT|nr:AI-2E family transporter [Flexibacter flexilis]SFB72180.1 Predicted PurR-regulated permease PerM [Flexibacter flexilis DSM 6793]
MNSIYTSSQRRNILVILVVLLGLFIVLNMRTYISYLVASTVLYVIFRKPYNKLLRRGWHKQLVVFSIIILSFLIIVLPFLLLSIMLTDKIIYYTSHIQDILLFVEKIEAMSGIKLRDKAMMNNVAENVGKWAGGLFPSFLAEATDMLVGLGLMYFVLYYMFVEQERFRKGLYVYLPFEPDTLEQLGLDLENNIHSNIIGQGLISLIQATMLALGFWVFGFSDALFWGMVGFFMSFIPVLGTPLIWVPAGLIALAQGDNFGGIGILLYGAIVVLNIDNVLRMFIASKMGDIHPLITLVGVILGVPILGIMGLVMGPLLISYFIIFVRVYRKKYVINPESQT